MNVMEGVPISPAELGPSEYKVQVSPPRESEIVTLREGLQDHNIPTTVEPFNASLEKSPESFK